VLLAACLLLVCGCDPNVIEQNDDVEPETGTVREGLVALYAGPDPTYQATTEGQCFADALLERVSLDELVTIGVVGDDGRVPPMAPMLTRDVAEAWVDAAGSCASYAAVSARALAARTSGLRVDEDAYADCLTAAIPPERAREALVATLTGDWSGDPAAEELRDAEAGCADEVRGDLP
jgi:hypothetical protein